MTGILGLTGVGKEAENGAEASFYFITDINVNRLRKEAIVVLQWYVTPQAFLQGKGCIDKSDYKISLDPTLTDEQLEEMGYIAKATFEDIVGIYTPTIDKIYSHIQALPEWADAVTVGMDI